MDCIHTIYTLLSFWMSGVHVDGIDLSVSKNERLNFCS